MAKRSSSASAVVPTLAGLAFAILAADARAAGTVGTGTAGSCTEAAFNVALGGGGAVTFNCGGAATIVFTTVKVIATATTISGGNVITLSGGGAVRLFNVTGGGLTLNNITLANGHDTVATPGAAAIDASANVTITESTISGHQTTNGGCPGVNMSGATLTIVRSTVTGNVNSASATGDAICSNNTATLNVTSSTITGNTGGAIDSSGTATVTNSTIAANTSTGGGNSGGISAFGGTITLRNTIVSNNVGTGQCSTAVGGSIVDGGGNLQFPDAACGATIPVANPLLGALASNGGPTQTMALGAGSPAIDAGVLANCQATDQRGQVPTDGNGDTVVVCDSGAFEAPAVAPTADVSVVKTLVTAGPYSPGQIIQYTLLVSNAGPATATNIGVTDTPTNLTIGTVSGACVALPCTIASLAPGTNTTINVSATIVAAGAFDNSATVSATESDPNPGNNTDNTGNGGTANFAASVPAASVPAVSGSGLALLAALVAFVGVEILRRRSLF